jgi:hypothetical protein
VRIWIFNVGARRVITFFVVALFFLLGRGICFGRSSDKYLVAVAGAIVGIGVGMVFAAVGRFLFLG